MIRTFRFPLEPTGEQKATFESWLLACQRLYNGALEHRIKAYEKGVNITRYDQHAELTQLRAEMLLWLVVPVEVLRSSLDRLDRAYQAFFRRMKAGEAPGFPRFRACDRYNSFSLPGQKIRVPEGNQIHIPKLGPVKFKRYRSMKGEVRQVHVRRTASRWYVCFVCDIGEAPLKIAVRTATGVDVGLLNFATVADGRGVDNPRFFRASEELVARRQRALEKKKRGSNSRKRAKRLAAKAHEKVRNQRLDHARQLAAELYREFDLVAHEDLDIRSMTKFPKSINDAAWGLFIRCLTSKAENAGKWAVPVDPRGTSQRCSQCGAIGWKSLSERTHACTCGLVLDRDHNAARNILALGLSAVQLTEGLRQ